MKVFLLISMYIVSFVGFSQKTFQSLIEQALREQKSEQYEASIATFTKADELKPNDPKCLEGLVKSYTFWSWALKINGENGDVKLLKAKKFATDFLKLYPNNSSAYRCEGYTYQYGAEYAQARISYRKAIELNDKDAESMFLLWTLGEENATTKLQSPLLAKALEINPNLGEAWQKMGDLYKDLKQFDEAIFHYRKALAVDPNYILYYSIASLQAQSNLIDSANLNYQKTVALKDDFAWGHYGMAYVYTLQDKYFEAAQSFERAINLNAAVYPYYKQMLNYYSGLEAFPIAEKSDRAVKNSQQVDDGYPKYYMEGIKYAQAFYYETAVEFLKKSEIYERKNENRMNMIASINAWLTHCYLQLGQYEKAIMLSEELLKLNKEHTVESDVAALLATISAVNTYWGRYDEAIKYYHLSIEKLKELKRDDLMGIALLNISVTYRMAENYTEAIKFGKEAEAHNKRLGDTKNEILAKNSVARALHEQGNTKEAIAEVKKAMALCKESKSESVLKDLQISLCDFYQASFDLKEANKLFPVVYAAQKPDVYPLNPANLRVFKIAASLAVKNKDIPGAIKYYDRINENYRAQVKNFFPTMSEEGKMLFYRTIKTDFEIFNSFVAQHYKEHPILLEEMYNNQLMSKSLLLNSSKRLKASILRSEDEGLITLYEAYLAKKELISKVFTMDAAELKSRGLDIKLLEKQKDSMEVVLGQKTALFEFAELKEPTWKNVQHVLKPEEAALEMLRFRHYDFSKNSFSENQVHYAILMLKGNEKKPTLVVLENGYELENKMYSFYTNSILLNSKESNSYDVYWSKIANNLEGIKKLFVAPDGVFHKINLNTLYNAKTNSYLIDEFDIAQITSTRDLLEVKKVKKHKRKRASLFGYPNYRLTGTSVRLELQGIPTELEMDQDPTMYASLRSTAIANADVLELPGTLIEVNTISSILEKNGWECGVYAKNKALEENIKHLDNPQILHVATHGFFNSQNDSIHPLLASGLLLAGASQISLDPNHFDIEDGILTAYEVMNMNLEETDLVVLSACETGSGIIENGEGVYGLQRALMVAGSKAVVMSLWKVDDEATKNLMITFYDAYIKSGDYRTAFRDAQQQLMKRYNEPRLWGAFVYIGE